MHGRFKCNIDAFFSASTNRLGIGMCILDKEGRFVSKTMWFISVCLVYVWGHVFVLQTSVSTAKRRFHSFGVVWLTEKAITGTVLLPSKRQYRRSWNS